MPLFKKIIALALALVLTISVCGCENKTKSFIFTAFSCPVTVCVYSKPISKKTKKRITQFTKNVEDRFSTEEDGSFVKRLNQLDSNESLQLLDDEYQILSIAKTAYRLSKGKFNPTVYPLVKLWKFAPYQYTLNFEPPTKEQIDLAKEKVDFDSIQLGENKTANKSNASVNIDLNAIVKGYVADKIAKILKDDGHYDGYVSVGSSSLNLLKVETLGIRHPRSTSQTILTINCKNEKDLSVSTSGDYEKFHLSASGQRFCHLIDPDTGYPTTTGVASATLLGVDGALADALTTALCLKEYSPNQAENPLVNFVNDILTEFPKTWIFIVYNKENDKKILTNKVLGQDFTLNDQSYDLITL